MGFLFALPRPTWLIYRMHLGTILGSRRTLTGIALVAIPPLLAFLAAQLAPDRRTGEEIFAALSAFLLIQFIVPMLGVTLGVGVIADEAEQRTITYPFTRPIPRAALFLGRWLATLTSVLILVGASGLGLAVCASMREGAADPEVVTTVLGTALLGAGIYSLGAAVIGSVAKRGLVIALGYAFAIEILMANIPGSSQKLTVQYHLRSIFVDPELRLWQRLDMTELTTFLEPSEALSKLLFIAAGLVVFGCWNVTRKQFVLSA